MSRFVPSGLDMIVGEVRVPIYKPFAEIVAPHTLEVRTYTIMRGSEIVETKEFPEPIHLTLGDVLVVSLDVNK